MFIIGLLVLSIITSTLVSVTRGYASKKHNMNDYNLWLFNLIANIGCTIGIILICIVSGISFKVSVFSAVLGLALGICNVLSTVYCLKAYGKGPFTYTAIILSFSSIIPTLSGLFFGETISTVQYIGILFMLICLCLSPEKTADNQGFNFKWLICCGIAFVFSGGLGVIQKLHQSSKAHKNEMAALLITGFVFSVIFSALKLLNVKNNCSNECKNSDSNKIIKIAAICGLSFAFPHTINLFLSGKLPAIIFFPAVNLCPMFLSMLYAFIILKETLSRKRWYGLGVGIIAIILLSGVI